MTESLLVQALHLQLQGLRECLDTLHLESARLRAELREAREMAYELDLGPRGAEKGRLIALPTPHVDREVERRERVEATRLDGPRVAVIDDDAAFLALMRDLLEGEGYTVTVWDGAGDLRPAIATLQPHLIILDWRLGRRDGGDHLLGALRRDPATAAIPVVICTADTRAIEEQGARFAADGARALAKPFELDDLLTCVAALVEPPASASA